MQRTQVLRGTVLALAVLLVLVLAACAAPPTPTPVPPTAVPPTAVPATKAPAATAVPATAVPPTAAPPPTKAAVPVRGVTDSEIALGSWGPQDGPAGAYGVIDRTIAAYWNMVNDQGGINGRKVRFIYENDSYQPAKTVAAVKKLVEEDKVFALVGGLGTANNLAVMEYLVQNNVPHVGPATGSTAMAVPLKKQVFAIQLNYMSEAILLTQYAVGQFKAKKIAVFYQNDSFGKEGLDTINAELKRQGLPEAVGVSYEAADTNFAAQALKLQTSGADAVILFAVPKPGASVIAEMGKLGYAPKLLSSAIINDPAIFQLAGAAMDGLVIPAWIPAYDDLTNPKIVEYQNFMKKYAAKEALGGFSLSGYVEAMVLHEGLKRTGKDLTVENFIKTMESMKEYSGSPLPAVTYSPTDHAGSKSAYLQKADTKTGKWISFTDWFSIKQ